MNYAFPFPYEWTPRLLITLHVPNKSVMNILTHSSLWTCVTLDHIPKSNIAVSLDITIVNLMAPRMAALFYVLTSSAWPDISISLTWSCLESREVLSIYSDILLYSLLDLKNILHRNFVYSWVNFQMFYNFYSYCGYSLKLYFLVAYCWC